MIIDYGQQNLSLKHGLEKHVRLRRLPENCTDLNHRACDITNARMSARQVDDWCLGVSFGSFRLFWGSSRAHQGYIIVGPRGLTCTTNTHPPSDLYQKKRTMSEIFTKNLRGKCDQVQTNETNEAGDGGEEDGWCKYSGEEIPSRVSTRF
jgi:hypothetical protein